MAGRKLRRLKACAVLVRERGHRGSGQRTQLRSQQFVVGRHNRCAELQLRSCVELSWENRDTHIIRSSFRLVHHRLPSTRARRCSSARRIDGDDSDRRPCLFKY